MKVILELNQFQKIIEIPEPQNCIEMYYQEPGVIFDIKEINKGHAKAKSMKRICFYFEKEYGNFLLYRYRG